MAKIYIVYGGAGSGKSEYAEALCDNLCGVKQDDSERIRDDSCVEENAAVPRKIYLATMKNDGSKAALERIERHKKLREGKGFITIEKSSDISEIETEENDTILLEDLSNLLSNRMFSDEKKANYDDITSKNKDIFKDKDIDFSKEIFLDILKLSYKVENIVIVSNDVFRDGLCYDNATERFVEELGKIHILLSRHAERIIRIIYGIPVKIKE